METEDVGLIDGNGDYIGVVTFLHGHPDGADLWGWTVSVPGFVVKNRLGRTTGRGQAISAALGAARELGISDPKIRG